MHHIYHTEGIILGSKNFGEAGRYYSIFTKDLGMIYASAQGVRKMSSKLRFILHDFAYVKVDLVQGKDFWRVTSAAKTNQLEEITKRPENFKILVNITRLLKRLLVGTEKNELLFDELLHGFFILENAKLVEERQDIEVNIVLQILAKLGYIEDSNSTRTRIQTISLINQALRETHL